MQDPAVISTASQSAEDRALIGDSIAMRKIAEVVEQVGPTDLTVLITGESGVGKEVVAKAIHAASARSRKPLITVNCGAIPEGIIESELFGHERGSFTGAVDQRKGYFELADGGTIFLDEIGELPLASQVKFLRVLENGEFLRVGSSLSKKVNVRVLAATNKDLEVETRQGRFRTDLFFRLRSVNIVIPPLRERPEDVPVLFRYFVEDVARKHQVHFAGISQEAMSLLVSYRWPGNVRELKNVVESMLVLGRGKSIGPDDVRRYLKDFDTAGPERNLPVPVAGKSVEQAERELIFRALLDIKGNLVELKDLLLERDRHERPKAEEPQDHVEESKTLSLDDIEQRTIAEALERFKGNRRVAARELHISERTLYRKIKDYGLE